MLPTCKLCQGITDDVHFMQSLEANNDVDERQLLLQYKNRALEDLTRLLYQPSINFMNK
jgi:hypothetical protein